MSVVAKIVAVMKEYGYMKKDKQLQGGGSYKYLSEESVTAELHAAFADAGIVIYPTAMEIIENREDTTRSGGILHNVRIRVTYQICDDDSCLIVQSLGEGSDSGDKAINKAMTAAYKYALRQTIMISTGDDPDASAHDEMPDTRLSMAVNSAREKSIAENNPGEVRVPFGKREGVKIAELKRSEVQWFAENGTGDFQAACQKFLRLPEAQNNE